MPVVSPTVRGRDDEAAAALRTCLRQLLGPVDARSGRWRLPAGLVADRFAAMAARHRVLPLLHRHLARLDLPADLTEHVRRQGEASRLEALLAARELVRALAVLRAAGVSVLVVKGLALAQVAYGDLAARGTGDLDLLVAPKDVGAAFEALREGGWRAGDGPLPGDGRPWRYGLRVGYERCLVGDRSVVDLHWRLDPTHGALPSFTPLWERGRTVLIAGTPVRTLGGWDTLMHSCSHAAKDDWWWLRSLADVAVLAADPEVWRSPPTRPSPVQQATLGLAVALLGQPPPLPLTVARTAAVRAAPLRLRVEGRHALLQPRPDRGRLPGLGTLATVRRHQRGSRAPADLLRVVLATLLPPHLLGGLAGRGGVVIALTLAGRRLTRLRLWRPGDSDPHPPAPGARRAPTW